jgi:cytochrome P450
VGENRRFDNARDNFHKLIANFTPNESTKSVLEVICEQHPKEDSAALIAAFIILGYDRFSSIFTILVKEIAKNGHLQDEIQQEIKASGRKFLQSQKLSNFINEMMKNHPVTPVVKKSLEFGVPLNGFFIPPNTNVFLYLAECHKDFINDANKETMSNYLMRIFIGEFIVRFKFHLIDEDKIDNGCGVSMRTKNVKIEVRNRF